MGPVVQKGQSSFLIFCLLKTKTIAAESLGQTVELTSAALRQLIADTKRAAANIAEAAAVARERCLHREQGDLKRLTARLTELDADRDRLAINMLRERLEGLAPDYVAKRDAFIAAEREVFGIARAIDKLGPRVANTPSAGSGHVRPAGGIERHRSLVEARRDLKTSGCSAVYRRPCRRWGC